MKALTALTGLFLLLWCSLSEAASRTDNPITFRFHCRKDGCCDHHEWCRFWASVGECKTNSEWMNDNCQLSCGTCGHPLSNRPKSTQAKQPRRPTHAQMSKPAHSNHVTHATQAPRPAHVTHAPRPAHVTHARRPVHVTHATHAPRPHVTPRPHLAPQPLRTHTNRRTRPHRPVHTTPKPTRRPVTHRRPAPRTRVTRPPHSVRPHFLTALRTRGRSRGFSHHIPSRVIVRPSTFAPATTSTTVAPTTTTAPSPTVAPTTTTMPTTTTTPSTTVAPSTTIAPTTTSTSTTTTTTAPLTTTTTVPATTRPSHTFIVHVTRPVHRQRPTVRPAPRTTPRPTTTTTPRTTTRTTTRATTTTTTRAPTTRHVDTAKDRRCREIISDPLVAAEELLREKLIESTEKNDDRRTIDLDQVIRSNIANACVPRLDETSCEQNMCYNAYFRTMDGTCNNLQHPLRGASYRPYTRLLPTVYDNDLSEPVGSLRPELRPSPREITRELTSSDASVESSEYNALIMQFGQFTSHDLAKTTLVPSSKCNVCQNITSRCMSVPVLADDPNTKFKQTTCIRVSRSSPICGSGNLKPRQQLNENTGYIDASPIYGSSVHDSMKFRDGKTGFLKLPSFRGLSTLPFDQSRCNGRGKCTVIFTAGDSRVNLFVGLSAWHTIFTREHNRIATALQRLNPHWDGERLYHETRKIIGAEMQAVVYREWLPKVLGASFAAVVGDYQGYDPNVDSTVANEFTSAAFRFGHGMIQEVYQRLDANFRNISFGPLPLQAGTLKSDVLVNQGGPDPILRGLFSQPVKRPQRITKAVTENMFRSTDLSSINIQRGRDHGHQSYTKYRELCGMGTATNFEHLSREILNTGTRQKLQRVYGTVDRIDLWVGALLEDPVVRGLVGPTVACIIGPQFKRTRDGDRFYYENPGVFTRRQLSEIRKSSLSRILCDNGQTITMVPREAFRIGHLTPCNQIPQMDLSKWKE